ncbi:hypothetical protein Tco_1277544 [Tanacetum coccineum]
MIRAVRINVPLVYVLSGMPNYRKFLKEFVSNKHKLEQISSAFLSDESSAIIQNKVPPKLGFPESFLIPCTFGKTFSYIALANLRASINLMPYSLYAKLFLYSIEGTPLEDKIFVEFDEFIAMNIEDTPESEFNEEEITLEKIPFDTNYKIKKLLYETPTDLKLKPLPDHLEYTFLEEPSFLPVIISSQLSE